MEWQCGVITNIGKTMVGQIKSGQMKLSPLIPHLSIGNKLTQNQLQQNKLKFTNHMKILFNGRDHLNLLKMVNHLFMEILEYQLRLLRKEIQVIAGYCPLQLLLLSIQKESKNFFMKQSMEIMAFSFLTYMLVEFHKFKSLLMIEFLLKYLALIMIGCFLTMVYLLIMHGGQYYQRKPMLK